MAQKADMDLAAAELDRRSRYLRSLIQQQKASNSNNPKAESLEAEKGEEKERRAPREEFLVVVKQQQEEKPPRKKGDVGRGGVVDPGEKNQGTLLRVRAADMPPELQKRAFRCAQQVLAHMPKLDSKRLALTLKKEFDSSYGPAWHCIVGKSFGSYVTHSLGGFLYFSIDKVYVLLFRTAVEPLEQ